VAFGEPSVKHAVIALGAINKAAAPGSEHSSFAEHRQAALIHYDKVLRLVREQLQSPSLDQRSLQTTLVACLLLGCFENALGGIKSMLPLFQSGANVLSSFHNDRRVRNLVSASTGSSGKHFHPYPSARRVYLI